MLDLKRLTYLTALYHHRSYTKASEELFVPQPAISLAVKALERQTGIQLLDRQAICPGRGGADPLRSVGCRALWPHPWHAFRDLIAAVTEDRDYGRRGYKTFHDLRLL